MKKYITVAALLAAGSAFANADEFTWTSTEGAFAGFKTTEGELVSFTGDFSLELVVKASARDDSFSVLLEDSSEAYTLGFENFHGTSNYELDLVLNSSEQSLGGHFSDPRIVNTPATFVFNFKQNDAGTYNVKLYVTAGDWTEWSDKSMVNNKTVDFGSDPLCWTSLALSETATVSSMTLTATPSSIPEPSAFGLLAGIGAFALVASRRRRK